MNQPLTGTKFEFEEFPVSSNRSLKSSDILYDVNNDGQVFSEKCLLKDKNYLVFEPKKMIRRNKKINNCESPSPNFFSDRSLDISDTTKTQQETPNKKSCFFSSCDIKNEKEKKLIKHKMRR